jgi:fructose-bisphosphate aldolase class II
MSEGGIDGGYTGQTPSSFVNSLLEYAEECSFAVPFIIHADHLTIHSSAPFEIQAAADLIAAQIEAGFTSFALDASFTPLTTNIEIVNILARPIFDSGFGLEVELGEVPSVGRETAHTTLDEVTDFLDGLTRSCIYPQLLAINNGSHTGNYLDSHQISIDLPQTLKIYERARAYGVAGLVQHGITGTPLRIVGKLADYGIRKGNIGTLWQNVAHAGLPLDLMNAMRKWARERDQDIKYATGVFKNDIDLIPQENIARIADMAYREALEFITAFKGKGSARRFLDWAASNRCE